MSEVVFDVTPVEVVVDQTLAEVSITTGPAGPTGATGATGATGPTGATGSSGVVSVVSPITNSGTSSAAVLGFDQSAQNTTNDSRYARLAAANAFTVGGHTITNASASVVPLKITGATSQTSNLFELADTTLTLSRFRSGGQLAIGGNITTAALTVNNGIYGASNIGVIVRGAASQSANLTEWQDSAASIIARVDSSGAGRFAQVVAGDTNHGSKLSVTNASASQVGAIIRGAASQSANLLEGQNSAGTPVWWGTNGGTIVATGQLQAGSGLARLQSSGGGQVQLSRMSAIASNPGSNVGVIYFRDGTTAGTLRLCVRAGTAGAETTILDNIPQ